MRSKFVCCFCLLLLPLLASCDRNPTETEEVFDPSGSLSFTYGGAVSGTYQATGEIHLDANGLGLVQFGTGASALQRGGALAMVAFRGASAPRGDFVALVLGEVAQPGTFPLNVLACEQQNIPQCRFGFFAPDVDPAEFEGVGDPTQLGERTYVLVTGSVTITHLTSMRVRGTFQASGLRDNQPGPENLITISSGVFDLPVRQ